MAAAGDPARRAHRLKSGPEYSAPRPVPAPHWFLSAAAFLTDILGCANTQGAEDTSGGARVPRLIRISTYFSGRHPKGATCWLLKLRRDGRSMSLELCILASGSAGNAALVRSPSGILLIDAGIGPRSLSKRLDGTGVRLPDITALWLTHLDGDHFSPRWSSTPLRLNIEVHCHANKVAGLALSCRNSCRSFGHLTACPFHRSTVSPVIRSTVLTTPSGRTVSSSTALVIASSMPPI